MPRPWVLFCILLACKFLLVQTFSNEPSIFSLRPWQRPHQYELIQAIRLPGFLGLPLPNVDFSFTFCFFSYFFMLHGVPDRPILLHRTSSPKSASSLLLRYGVLYPSFFCVTHICFENACDLLFREKAWWSRYVVEICTLFAVAVETSHVGPASHPRFNSVMGDGNKYVFFGIDEDRRWI